MKHKSNGGAQNKLLASFQVLHFNSAHPHEQTTRGHDNEVQQREKIKVQL